MSKRSSKSGVRKSAKTSPALLTTRQAKEPSIVHQPTLRALMLFDSLPLGHGTFRVTDAGSEPHLKTSEYAVVDLLDRELQHGEIYVVHGSSGIRRRRINQARSSYCNITGPGADESLVWWLGDIRGYRKTDERLEGIPVFAGLSDGPYLAENLQWRLVGRVVGFASKSLGKPIAPEAGFRDEIGGNAAFDPVEYLDVLIATGHKPAIYGGRYFEEMPHRPLSDVEKKAVLAVHWKYVEASTALDRVKQECTRRGLTDIGRAA